MFSPATYQQRRQQLIDTVDSGLILLLGNREVGMNYGGNIYHFRQDSSFLYFVGIDKPNLAAVIDVDSGKTTLYGDDLTIDDVIWMGVQPRMTALADRAGITHSSSFSNLAEAIQVAANDDRAIHFLPPYRDHNRIYLAQTLGIELADLKQEASIELVKAVVAQRNYKTVEEVQEMEIAVNTSVAFHEAMMKSARPGMREWELAGIAEGIAASCGGALAYPVIVTTRGHVLHNHDHHHQLAAGDLVLVDAGASTTRNYAGDLTRTFPVNATFSAQQKEVYEVVLQSQLQAIEALKPGVPYQEIHLLAARKIAEGLKQLGLMKGNIEEAVAAGAHALFFPHGLGHMIGLDVHDMEDLGEDLVGYSDTIQRSDQFGTAYLRLGKVLEKDNVITVEPGVYFIPELIDQWASEKLHSDFIDYSVVAKYRDFTGIRIEDDILITEDGYRILGKPLAKTVAEVEALRAEG